MTHYRSGELTGFLQVPCFYVSNNSDVNEVVTFSHLGKFKFRDSKQPSPGHSSSRTRILTQISLCKTPCHEDIKDANLCEVGEDFYFKNCHHLISHLHILLAWGKYSACQVLVGSFECPHKTAKIYQTSQPDTTARVSKYMFPFQVTLRTAILGWHS